MTALEALRRTPNGLTIRELNRLCQIDRVALLKVLDALSEYGLAEFVRICDRWRVTERGRVEAPPSEPEVEVIPEPKRPEPKRAPKLRDEVYAALRRGGSATAKQLTTRVNLHRRATERGIQTAVSALVRSGAVRREMRLIETTGGLRSVAFFELSESR